MDDFTVRMQNAPGTWKDQANKLAEKVSAVAASMPLAVRHAKFIEGLGAGDSVYVIPFKREAIIDRIRRKREKMVVLMEGKQLQVSFEDICRLPGVK